MRIVVSLVLVLLLGVAAGCDARTPAGDPGKRATAERPVPEVSRGPVSAPPATPPRAEGLMAPHFFREGNAPQVDAPFAADSADENIVYPGARSSALPYVIGRDRMSILLGAGLARRDPRSEGFQGLLGVKWQLGSSTALRLDGVRRFDSRTSKNSAVRLGLTLQRPSTSPNASSTASESLDGSGRRLEARRVVSSDSGVPDGREVVARPANLPKVADQ